MAFSPEQVQSGEVNVRLLSIPHVHTSSTDPGSTYAYTCLRKGDDDRCSVKGTVSYVELARCRNGEAAWDSAQWGARPSVCVYW